MSGTGEDVATISYEQALHTHRRVGTAEPLAQSMESSSAAAAEPPEVKKPRKACSVTVRVTGDEQKLLQTRAAEAGLSVSAYLRSCIFEVESLRFQVKEALAEMRNAAALEPQVSEKRPSPPERRHFRLFPLWTRRQTADG